MAKSSALHVNVILLPNVLLLDFVLEHARPHATAPYPLEVVVLDRLLLLGLDAIRLALDLLLVVPVLETPLDVGGGRVLDVLLDVVECMLGHVGDAKVVMDEESTVGGVGGLGIPHDHFDQGGLSRTISTNQGNAGTQ